MFKKALYIFLLFLSISIAWYWSLIYYAISQGIGQLNIVYNTRPVQELLEDTSFPDSLKQRLLLINEIRKFAIDSLGLKDTENYTNVYDQKGKEIMWVVTASRPFQLEPKLWSFPILGSVPYKGYFDQKRAEIERDCLVKEGWDTSIRNPGAWSTLGWFKDPILTGMLEDSDGGLASTIIHEMVHSTIWITDNVDYNENLASFIADTAAYSFLAYKYGLNSQQYNTYHDSEYDYKKFSNHMLRGAKSLDVLYSSFSTTLTDSIKRKKKKEQLLQIVTSLDTLSLKRVKNPSKRFSTRLPNNAYFMGFRHYHSKLPVFKKEFEERYNGNIKEYIKYLKTKHPKD